MRGCRIAMAFSALEILTASVLMAQGVGKTTLRESFDTKLIPQPAFLQLTRPASADPIIAIGAALKYEYSPDPFMDLAPFVEIARSTETSKEQDVLKLGGQLDWRWWNIGPADPLAAVPSPSDIRLAWTPNVLASGNYKRDGIKDTESLQVVGTLTAIFRGRGKRPEYFYLPSVRTDLGIADFQYMPYAGFEYEVPFAGPDSIGDVFRTLLRVQAAAYPHLNRCLSRPARNDVELAMPRCQDRVQITLDYAYRRDYASELDDRSHPYFEARLDFYLVGTASTDRSASIGVSYINGEDPSKGFLKQELTRFAFKIRL